MGPEIPVQPGRVPESLLDQKQALAEFEREAAAYQEHIAKGGIDLSELTEEQKAGIREGNKSLKSLGITNRASARRAGIHTRRMHGRQGAVPTSKKKTKLKMKALRKRQKAARKKNRG